MQASLPHTITDKLLLALTIAHLNIYHNVQMFVRNNYFPKPQVQLSNLPVNSRLQHLPRGNPPGVKLLKIGFFKTLPSGQKGRWNVPPISIHLSHFSERDMP